MAGTQTLQTYQTLARLWLVIFSFLPLLVVLEDLSNAGAVPSLQRPGQPHIPQKPGSCGHGQPEAP